MKKLDDLDYELECILEWQEEQPEANYQRQYEQENS